MLAGSNDDEFLDIVDVITLSEFPLFDKVWFYLCPDQAYMIPDRSTGEKAWLEEGWYDAKIFYPVQM